MWRGKRHRCGLSMAQSKVDLVEGRAPHPVPLPIGWGEGGWNNGEVTRAALVPRLPRAVMLCPYRTSSKRVTDWQHEREEHCQAIVSADWPLAFARSKKCQTGVAHFHATPGVSEELPRSRGF
jgi:hypothetical protein